jgi:hypothetical protein
MVPSRAVTVPLPADAPPCRAQRLRGTARSYPHVERGVR